MPEPTVEPPARAIAVDLNGVRKTYLAVCPHRGGPLAEGWVDGDAIVCPWHRFRYQARTGEGQEQARLLGLCLRPAPEGAKLAATLRADDGSPR